MFNTKKAVEILKDYYEELTENLNGEFETPHNAEVISGAFLCAKDGLQNAGYVSTLKMAVDYIREARHEGEYPLTKKEVAEDIDVFLELAECGALTA